MLILVGCDAQFHAAYSLLYILKAKNIQKIYIPYYLCDSISDILQVHNYNFEYYNIDTQFDPIFNKNSLGDVLFEK